jgi:hypothetical protein
LTVAGTAVTYASIAPHAHGLLPALLAGVGVTAVYTAVAFAWVLDPRERAALGLR